MEPAPADVDPIAGRYIVKGEQFDIPERVYQRVYEVERKDGKTIRRRLIREGWADEPREP